MNETQQEKAKSKGIRIGQVHRVSGTKTISVVVDTLVKHPRYEKYMRRRTKLAVHDPGNEAGVGDMVEIVPCRRLSKNKSWRLRKVVRRSALS